MRLNELEVARGLRIDGFSWIENAVVKNERFWIGEMILRLARTLRYVEKIRNDGEFFFFGSH